MRLGGELYACKSGKVARHVVTALVVVAGFAVAGQGLSAGGAETTKDLWALTRDAHGRIHVVRGLDASAVRRKGPDGQVAVDERRAATAAVGLECGWVRIGVEAVERRRCQGR